MLILDPIPKERAINTIRTYHLNDLYDQFTQLGKQLDLLMTEAVSIQQMGKELNLQYANFEEKPQPVLITRRGEYLSSRDELIQRRDELFSYAVTFGEMIKACEHYWKREVQNMLNSSITCLSVFDVYDDDISFLRCIQHADGVLYNTKFFTKNDHMPTYFEESDLRVRFYGIKWRLHQLIDMTVYPSMTCKEFYQRIRQFLYFMTEIDLNTPFTLYSEKTKIPYSDSPVTSRLDVISNKLAFVGIKKKKERIIEKVVKIDKRSINWIRRPMLSSRVELYADKLTPKEFDKALKLFQQNQDIIQFITIICLNL